MNMHQKALSRYGLFDEPKTLAPKVEAPKQLSGAEEMDEIFGAPAPTPAQQIKNSRADIQVLVKDALKSSKCHNRMCGSYNARDIVGCSRIQRPSSHNCSIYMGLE